VSKPTYIDKSQGGRGAVAMDKTVASLNILHFKKLLETETDRTGGKCSNGCSLKKGLNWRSRWPKRLKAKPNH
jgi:hypothetical protein